MTNKNLNKVAGYRKMFNLNQTYVANMLDIGLNTYSNKETNKTEFTLSEIIAITKLFKEYNPQLTMDDIFFKSSASV